MDYPPSSPLRNQHGFTLLELLVAMAIVAVIGVIALTGLNTAINQQEIAEDRAERPRRENQPQRRAFAARPRLHRQRGQQGNGEHEGGTRKPYRRGQVKQAQKATTETVPQGGRSGIESDTFCQVAPPSRVTWTSPSSEPTQITPSSRGDSMAAKMVP